MVRLYRTFSNLSNKMCRVPVHCFRVVQPPRTFSNHFSQEKARCVEVFDMSSEWFDCTEPSRTSSWNKVCRVPVHYFRVVQHPRTFSNHFSSEKARCVEVFDVSSEWFDCTEPSRTSSSQWEQGVCVGYLYTISEWFNPLEPPRTFSIDRCYLQYSLYSIFISGKTGFIGNTCCEW